MEKDENIYAVSKERIELLFDAGTFVEIGAYTKRASAPNELEGAVCGYGAVEGKLTFAFVQDNGRSAGAFGERQSKKISALYDLAIKNGAPVIGIFDSAGAFVGEGAASLAAYGRLYSCISAASGVVPQIAVADGICGASLAVAAAMFDFTVTIKDKSKLYASPAEQTADADYAKNSGQSAHEAENIADAAKFVKKLLKVLPQNNADSAYVENTDDVNRKLENTLLPKGKELIEILSDKDSFIPLFDGYGENIVLGFATFGGLSTGVVASNNDGVLDIKAARLLAKFISFCDSFNIPLLFLADSVGLDMSAKSETSAYANELARLSFAHATSKNAKVTVITGKAYGAAFTLLGSKSMGADLVFALPEALISVLSPEASVAFLWNDKVGTESREELETRWKTEQAAAEIAAESGEIDDIINPAELRQRICAALSMLMMKADTAPVSRHPILPI